MFSIRLPFQKTIPYHLLSGMWNISNLEVSQFHECFRRSFCMSLSPLSWQHKHFKEVAFEVCTFWWLLSCSTESIEKSPIRCYLAQDTKNQIPKTICFGLCSVILLLELPKWLFVFFQSVLHCYKRLPQIKAFKLSNAFVVSYFQRLENSGSKNYQLAISRWDGENRITKRQSDIQEIQRE